MQLFHTGFSEIRFPDIRRGRTNADFGMGFYLSDSEDFSKRWARERHGVDTVINRYELCTEGLMVKTFQRDKSWFDYITSNRSARPDSMDLYDVIIGPIANDTIYDTWGILTSGLLQPETALQLLRLGNEYRQIVIKTDKAVSNLQFLSSSVLSHEEIAAYRETVRQEEQAYQMLIKNALGDFLDMLD